MGFKLRRKHGEPFESFVKRFFVLWSRDYQEYINSKERKRR